MAEEKLDFRIRAIDEGSAIIGQFAANARRAAQQAEGGGGIEGAKELFGRTGKFTEAFHVLGGAGPIIGLGLAARELGEMAEKMSVVKADLRDMNKNAADVGLDFLKIIPIVGDFATAGEAINELLTNQKHEIDLITESTKLQDEYTKQHVTNVLSLQNAYAQVAETVAKIAAETKTIGLQGHAGSYAQIATDIQTHLRNAQNSPQMQAELTGLLTNETAKKIEDLRKGKADQQQELYLARSKYEADKAGALPYFEKTGGKEDRGAIAAARQRVQQTDAQIASLQADQKKAEKQIRDKYAAENSADIQKDNAELLAIQREYAQQRVDQTNEAEKNIRDTQAQAKEAALKNSRQYLAADLLAIQHGLDEENNAIDIALRKRMKEIDQAQRAGLLSPLQAGHEADAAQLGANRQKQANADKASADSDAARQNAAIQQQQMEQQISQIKLGALSSALELAGKSMEYERESLRISQEYADKRHEISELMKTATAEQRQELGLTLQMLAADEKTAHEVQAAKVLQEAVNAPLQEAAAAGNRIAGLMLKQQEIQREFADRSRALDSIINDKDATEREKALARSAKAGLSDEERRAMLRAAAASMPFVNPNAQMQTVQSIGSFGVQGYAQMAQEQAYLSYRQPLGLTTGETSRFHTGDDLQRDMIKELQDANTRLQMLVEHTGDAKAGGKSKQTGVFLN